MKKEHRPSPIRFEAGIVGTTRRPPYEHGPMSLSLKWVSTHDRNPDQEGPYMVAVSRWKTGHEREGVSLIVTVMLYVSLPEVDNDGPRWLTAVQPQEGYSLEVDYWALLPTHPDLETN